MTLSTSIQAVFDTLNLRDALAFKDAFPTNTIVEQCYKERINPQRYLSKSFPRPVTLLSAMFDTGSILSGSRALEYFIPGSTAADSDWDFYVPGYKESIGDMIQALTLCGVQWDLEGDKIITYLSRDGQVKVDIGTLNALQSWTLGLLPAAAIEIMGEKLYDILQAFKHAKRGQPIARTYTIVQETDAVRVLPDKLGPNDAHYVIPETYEDSANQPFGILRGSICTASGTQAVQLIVGSYYGRVRGCLSFVQGFYASHVQCFLGGWCASHMYYDLASSKKATRWEHSYAQQTPAIDTAIKKYEERGFSFHRGVESDPAIRYFGDDRSLLVDYGDIHRRNLRKQNLDLLDIWLEQRRKNMNTIQWVDLGDRISTISSPLYKCMRGSTSYAASGWRHPLTRLRRLADLTASSDTPEVGDFRSTLFDTLNGNDWHVEEAARSGNVFGGLCDATPWSWVM